MKKHSFWLLNLLVPALAPAQSVTVVQTNADKSALLAAQPSVAFGTQSPQLLKIVIDDSIQYQKMDGFGASFTDSSAWLVWNKLTAAQRNTLMRNLFTPAGANLSFLRQPMGATDLALSNYTYDDLPAGEIDPTMQRFSIAHDQPYIIPVVRQALSLNPKTTVMALPWSPPAWMKFGEGQTPDGGSFDDRYLPALARYFTKFIRAYADNGIPVTRIAVQNEPLNNNTGYPTLHLTDSQEAQFIANNLGPALAGFNPGNGQPIEILGYEHNWDVQWYAEWLLSHPDAARYLAGTSFHCYAGDPATAYSVMNEFFPEKELWFTECSGTVGSNFGGDLGWNTDHLTIGSVRGGAKSVVLWNMALDQNSGPVNGQGCQNCRGVVTIDTSTTPAGVSYNVEYYVLAQAAKFVVPGARRIDSNSFSGGIENVAFKNPDGSIVALVYNAAAAPTSFSVQWNSRSFSYTLPAGAVATFKWSGLPSGIGASPASRVMAQGNTTQFDIDVNGTTPGHSIALRVAGLPGGADASFVNAPGSDHLSLVITTASSTPIGSYNLTIAPVSTGPVRELASVRLIVAAPAAPFSGTPAPLPGVVQAENWDNGVEGIAFNNLDLFSHPDASPYRPGVDVSLENTTDSGGGYDVSYIGAGEWLDYSVNVTASGLYSIQSRLASMYGGTFYHVEVDGNNVTGQLYFPNTGGWQNWFTSCSPAFFLSSGHHVFRYVFESNNANGGVGNFNWFALESAALGTSQPYGGSPAAVPGTIQVENFDLGGKNAAYYNSSTTNATLYRTSDTVGIEATSDTGGGYDVGNTEPGEWLNYTAKIAASRLYTLHVRVATDVPGGTFHLACDGKQVTPSITVPQTGGWETFLTVDVPDVSLPSGRHVLQLVMENGGVYPAVANFNWFSLD